MSESHSSRSLSGGRRTLAFLIGAGFASVFFLNFCDAVYQCGCRSLWDGADAHCNVFDETNRDCPFCAHRPWGDAIPLGAILSAQGFVCFSRSKMSMRVRALGALLAFPVIGGLVAIAFGILTDYWGGSGG